LPDAARREELATLDGLAWPIAVRLVLETYEGVPDGGPPREVQVLRHDTDAASLSERLLAVELLEEDTTKTLGGTLEGAGRGLEGGLGGGGGKKRPLVPPALYLPCLHRFDERTASRSVGTPFAIESASALFIDIEVKPPEGAGRVRTIRRALFDRRGLLARRDGKRPAELGRATIFGRMAILSTDIGLAAPDVLVARAGAALGGAHPLPTEMGLATLETVRALLRATATLDSRALAVEPALALTIAEWDREKVDDPHARVALSLDLTSPPRRAFPVRDGRDRLLLAVLHGLIDVGIERLAGNLVRSPARIPDAASERFFPDEDSVIAVRDEAGLAAIAGAPDVSLERMRLALREGHIVLAAAARPADVAPEAYRFFTLDPATGRFVDVTEAGLHGDTAEKSLLDRFVEATKVCVQKYGRTLAAAGLLIIAAEFGTVGPKGAELTKAVSKVVSVADEKRKKKIALDLAKAAEESVTECGKKPN
jgi:hypothetical protein